MDGSHGGQVPSVLHLCLLTGRDSLGQDGFAFYTVPRGDYTFGASCSNAIAIFCLRQSHSSFVSPVR